MPDALVGGHVVDGLALEQDLAGVRLSRPATVLSRVDLPPPLAPMKAKVSPSSTREVDGEEGLEVAVEDVDVLELEEAHTGVPPM